MNHREQIAALLRQWLAHTRHESDAIKVGDWTTLRQIQADRETLRPAFSAAVEQWRSASPNDFSLADFAADIARLLALESHNVQLLAARRHQARQRKLALEQAMLNIKRVRSTYAAPAKPLVQSYS